MGCGTSKIQTNNKNKVTSSTQGSSLRTRVNEHQARTTIDFTSLNTDAIMEEYELKKHRPGCTGMFWRSDPTKKTSLASNNNWPRDGAIMRGQVVVVNGEKWLLAKQVKQKGKDWVHAPEGAAMPFEYNQHYYLE